MFLSLEEEEEIQTNGTENLFNEITAEIFPNPWNGMDRQVLEVLRTPNRHDQKELLSDS